MKHYVIGEDKSLEEAYTATEANAQLADVNATVASIDSEVITLKGKVKNITSGTAAPSGGANGDIYLQY